MTDPDIRHLHIELPADLHEELNSRLPWGTKKRVLEALIRQLIASLSGPYGEYVLGAMLSGELDLTDKFKPKE